jgi:hypothetical protein
MILLAVRHRSLSDDAPGEGNSVPAARWLRAAQPCPCSPRVQHGVRRAWWARAGGRSGASGSRRAPGTATEQYCLPATEQSHRAQPNGPPCRNRTAPLGGPAQQGNVSVRESADRLLRETAQPDRRGSTAGSLGSRARGARIGRGGLPRVASRSNDSRSGSRGMECVGRGAAMSWCGRSARPAATAGPAASIAAGSSTSGTPGYSTGPSIPPEGSAA